MKTAALRFLGKHLVQKASKSKSSPLEFLNPLLGFEMMMDLTVPLGRKALAIGAGILITGGLVVLEVPLDLLIAAVPGIGIGIDFLINGSEALVLPMLIACILLPSMADPKTKVKYLNKRVSPESLREIKSELFQ